MHDEIGVNAVLDRHWSAWFDGLEVSSDEHGQTTITGPVDDQAACTACWVRDLALELLAVGSNPADTNTKGTTMQPSTHQTAPGTSVAGLPASLLALVVVAGSASLFATYWDDAWHTDLGRDQPTIPPHVLLYASMATIGAVVAAWGLSALQRTGRWRRSGGSPRCG